MGLRGSINKWCGSGCGVGLTRRRPLCTHVCTVLIKVRAVVSTPTLGVAVVPPVDVDGTVSRQHETRYG